MNFIFTDEQLELRAVVREFLADKSTEARGPAPLDGRHILGLADRRWPIASRTVMSPGDDDGLAQGLPASVTGLERDPGGRDHRALGVPGLRACD
jgi:hypothetical protein